MLISDWVAEFFREKAIDRIFLYPGGTIVPLINACLKAGIRIECFKNEQGAGYAALAFARVTGKPQVVMVTSGPGVTNAISPLADAYYDSTPLLLVTGQIGTADLKVRKSVRQRGFQEVPTTDIARPISKRAVCLLTANDVFREVPEAFRIAMDGRRGPVVIDFPMDMQRKELTSEETPSAKSEGPVAAKNSPPALNDAVVREIAAAAAAAKRPVLLFGQGALSAGRFNQYRHMANDIEALVTTSFLGIGSYDTADVRNLGFVGHTGHLAANRAVFECDFLLVLGSRLDVRQTGTVVDKFAPNASVAWVDIDRDELVNPRVQVKWKVESGVAEFCHAFLKAYQRKSCSIDYAWRESLLSLKQQGIEDPPEENSIYVQPRPVLQFVAHLIGRNDITVVTGVGCHQHWAARHLSFRPNSCQLLTSGGHGTMGYDLPSAIGAAMAQPDRRVLCAVGDGSFLMNIQELASLRERNLDVKIIVFNNNRLGIVSQFQLITWGADPTTGNFKAPDFVAITRGFGIPADRLQSADDLETKLTWLWNQAGPALLDVSIDPDADVVPMLLAGQTMGEMWMGRKS